MSGLDFQAELVKANNSIPIILMTGHGDVPVSVKAMKLGAVDFEREVMMLVVTGLMNKQIAAQLGVTEATVKFHRGRVREKLDVRSAPI